MIAGTSRFDVRLAPDGELACALLRPRNPAPVDRALLAWLWDRAQQFVLFANGADVRDPPSEQQPLGKKRRARLQHCIATARQLTPEPRFFKADDAPACEWRAPLMFVGKCAPEARARLLDLWAASLVWPGFEEWEDLVLLRDDRLIYWSVSHEGEGAFHCREAERIRAGGVGEVVPSQERAYRLAGVAVELEAWVG